MRRIQKPAQVLNILVLFGSICSESKGLVLRAWQMHETQQKRPMRVCGETLFLPLHVLFS